MKKKGSEESGIKKRKQIHMKKKGKNRETVIKERGER